MPDTELVPAAQYLRMSTEHQQYSMFNQGNEIEKYAKKHGFVVVRTYSDAGKTGLVLKKRAGLCQLLRDVVSGVADYKSILVYDISRWGRFQNNDEPACYEFLCTHAGVPVHYCAEQFPNDGSLQSTLLKALKRLMAGEYSRELGARVITAQRNVVRLGYWVGGPAGYGMRRVLVSRDGKYRHELQYQEQRYRQFDDRVVLAPGPENEVQCVKSIYSMFISSRGRMGPEGIARELNRRGLKFTGGKEWKGRTVQKVLTNPKYAGCNTWGRTTGRLCGPVTRVSPEDWITKNAAFPFLIDRKTYEQAQIVMKRIHARKTDEQLLEDLRKLLARKGRLSKALIDSSKTVGGTSTYENHFGSLAKTYELVGFDYPQVDVIRKKSDAVARRLKQELLETLCSKYPGNVSVYYLGRRRKRPILMIDKSFSVSILVARYYRTPGGKTGWKMRRVPGESGNITLVCLMNTTNSRLESFYLFRRITQRVIFHKFNLRDPWLREALQLRGLGEFYASALMLETK